MRFYFIVAVWGEKHLELFVDISLPSMLGHGNIPGLHNLKQCKFIIYTNLEDETRLTRAPSFQQLSKCMPVEIAHIHGPITNAWQTMSDCHRAGMAKADQDDAAAVFPPADCIWSEGSFKRLEEILGQGKSVIFNTGIRLNRDEFRDDVIALRSPDGTFSISSSKLVTLGLKHLHKCSQTHFWREYEGPQMPANFYWTAPNEGILAHCYHLHPLLVKSQKKFASFQGTIDDDLVLHSCPDESNYYIVSDSDDMHMFEMSGPERCIGGFYPKACIDNAAAWVEYSTNKVHRKLVKSPIRIHGSSITPEAWKPVEMEALRIVEKIDKITNMPTVLLLFFHQPALLVRLAHRASAYLPERFSRLIIRITFGITRRVERLRPRIHGMRNLPERIFHKGSRILMDKKVARMLWSVLKSRP
jgi:hypothetical protein